MKATEQRKTIIPTGATQTHREDQEKVTCDRCGKVMFRMRAVYWCEHCGYKTDCCGS